MPAFRDFELRAIALLAQGVLTASELELLREIAAPSRHEYTGCGYYITVAHPALPQAPRTLSAPVVVGSAGTVEAGFVVYLGEGELTLECHSWGDVDVPEDFRDRDVAISTALLDSAN